MTRVPVLSALCLLLVLVALPAQAVVVYGAVIDYDGEAQSDVQVSFKPIASEGEAGQDEQEEACSAWTDDEGYFECDLATGTYRVTLTAAGYPPETIDSVVVGEIVGEDGSSEGTLDPDTLEVSW